MGIELIGPSLGGLQAAGAVPTLVRKTMTFTGAAGLGAVGTMSVFQATGDILLVSYNERCVSDVEGAGTLETGVTGATSALMAQTADATDATEDRFKNSSTGAWSRLGLDAIDGGAMPLIGGAQIFMTIGSTNLTAGEIECYAMYIPLSAGAVLTPTVNSGA